MRTPETFSRPSETPEPPRQELPEIKPRSRAVRGRLAYLAPVLALAMGCSSTAYELGREDQRAEPALRSQEEHFTAIGRAKMLRQRLVAEGARQFQLGTSEGVQQSRLIGERIIQLDEKINAAYRSAQSEIDGVRRTLESEMATIAAGTGVSVPGAVTTPTVQTPQDDSPQPPALPE